MRPLAVGDSGDRTASRGRGERFRRRLTFVDYGLNFWLGWAEAVLREAAETEVDSKIRGGRCGRALRVRGRSGIRQSGDRKRWSVSHGIERKRKQVETEGKMKSLS